LQANVFKGKMVRAGTPRLRKDDKKRKKKKTSKKRVYGSEPAGGGERAGETN